MHNKIELIAGRLGINPYLAYTRKGEPVCEMSVGIVNDQSATIWRKVVVFGRLAELCSVHLRKGNEVFVRGHVFLKTFTNKEGLEKEYFEVRAFSIGQSLL
ncbi:MAG: single-stranded DNA-binding protein [Bacteriovorax sp.]|nr:single-stranded DNA-binding protein [Bacteriovorax sp.]